MSEDQDLREKFHNLDKRQAVKEVEDKAREDIEKAREEAKEAVRERDIWWIKKLIAMCLVMWSSTIYVGRELGRFLYDNYAPVRIGVDAAIAAWRARNG